MKKEAKLIKKAVEQKPICDNLVEEIYTNLTDYFNEGSTAQTSHLGKVLNKYLKSMETTSKTAFDAKNSLAFIIDLSKETQAYIDSKKAADKDFIIYNLQRKLFKWQKPVYEDESPIVSMMCGRRSGKSHVVAYKMIKHCMEGTDNVVVEGQTIRKFRKAVYIGLTIEKAASIMWELLKKIIEENRIPVKKIDNGKYNILFSNGNEIQLLGNNSKAESEKIRGLEFSFCAIDEMQSQQGILYLITSIVQPILKGRNGQLTMLGTGPLSAGTYWEQQLNNPDVAHYKATMADNPTIPKGALEDVLKENGWGKDNITYRREYLGEVAYDTNVQVFPVRKYYSELPKDFHIAKCVAGIDFGWTDNTAIAPILFNDRNEAYLVHEFKAPHLAASAIVEKCREITDFIHKTYNIPVEDIYLVADNNEQNIVRDIYNKGITNIQCAYKQGEAYQIAMVKDWLESGQLLITKDGYFDQECDRVCWKVDDNGQIIYELDDKLYHGDIDDAVKYALNFYISYIQQSGE
jgi:hypothetical protein